MTGRNRVLEFNVNKQRLTRVRSCDFSNIVAGSVGYLEAKFYFTQDEWSGCKKAASFWVDEQEHAVILKDDNSCVIPSEVLAGHKFSVSVTGVRTNFKIVTNRINVRQEVC